MVPERASPTQTAYRYAISFLDQTLSHREVTPPDVDHNPQRKIERGPRARQPQSNRLPLFKLVSRPDA